MSTTLRWFLVVLLTPLIYFVGLAVVWACFEGLKWLAVSAGSDKEVLESYHFGGVKQLLCSFFGSALAAKTVLDVIKGVDFLFYIKLCSWVFGIGYFLVFLSGLFLFGFKVPIFIHIVSLFQIVSVMAGFSLGATKSEIGRREEENQ
jgi:hypothetical protein